MHLHVLLQKKKKKIFNSSLIYLYGCHLRRHKIIEMGYVIVILNYNLRYVLTNNLLYYFLIISSHYFHLIVRKPNFVEV